MNVSYSTTGARPTNRHPSAAQHGDALSPTAHRRLTEPESTSPEFRSTSFSAATTASRASSPKRMSSVLFRPARDRPAERYRAFVMQTIGMNQLQAIRRHVQSQHAFGTHRFREAIEAPLGRPAQHVKVGRPSRLLKNSLVTQPRTAATTKRARKCLIRRERVRTCAGLAT